MSFEPDALWRLRSPRLFEGLAPQDLRALAPLLDVRRHRRGDVVFYTGEKADRVFFLDEGAVKISATSPEGKERILDLLTPGHIFGELFVGADGRRTAAAETLSPVTLRTIAEGALMDLLHTLPRLGLNFVRHLVHQHRRAHFRLAAMLHMKPGPRLLAILVDLAEHCGEREGDDYAGRRVQSAESGCQCSVDSNDDPSAIGVRCCIHFLQLGLRSWAGSLHVTCRQQGQKEKRWQEVQKSLAHAALLRRWRSLAA